MSKIVIPYPNNPHFLGRENEMQTLRDILEVDAKAIITGISGVGKTQLTTEYAHKYQCEYLGGILWLKAGYDVVYEYSQLANELGLNLEQDSEDVEKCRKVQQHLNQREEKTLLVLDNLDEKKEYESIRPFLPSTDNNHLVITSKNDIETDMLLLEVLTEEEALQLLLEVSKREVQETEFVKEICELLHRLPLAIEIAGKYFTHMPHFPFEKYYKRLIARGLVKGANVSEVVKAILEVNPGIVDNAQLMKVLTTIVCFAPESINPQLLLMISSIKGEKEFDKIIKTLIDLSIVRVQEDKRLSIHRLVKDAVMKLVKKSDLVKVQKKYVKLLEKWFVEYNDVKDLEITLPEIPHILEATTLAFRLNIWPQSYVLSIALEEYYHLKAPPSRSSTCFNTLRDC